MKKTKNTGKKKIMKNKILSKKREWFSLNDFVLRQLNDVYVQALFTMFLMYLFSVGLLTIVFWSGLI